MNSTDRSNSIDLGAIFRDYGPAYRAQNNLPTYVRKVMDDIEKCRTEAAGGHMYECNKCGHQKPCYSPCGNRHCPKCDFLKKEKWLIERKKDLLPVTYYHNVLTIPDDLNPIAQVNQRVLYKILFRSGSETLIDLCKDPKHMGAQIGLIAFLHTWGQPMIAHPHLHCIVPGVGLSDDQSKVIYPKKSTEKRDFFIHINILSELFKKKFLAYFKEAYQKNELIFVGKTEYLGEKKEFQALIDKLYAKKWNTYCKSPSSGAKKVLEYLGRYAYRVAISNRRILKLEDGKVTFKWWDYRDSTEKLMTLDAHEFIRRFLLHVLPPRFFKIRYYGILASCNSKTKLRRCKELLSVKVNQQEEDAASSDVSWEDIMYELFGIDYRKCPICEEGEMIRKEVIPKSKGPP